MPSLADVALAIVLGLLGIPVGMAAGRLVLLFPRHDPEPDDESGPPPPTCPECSTAVPFLRWAPMARSAGLALHGRCPGCATTLPLSGWTVASTVVVFALVGLTGTGRSPFEFAALLFFGAVGALLSVIDARVHRLPNVLVLPAYPIALVLLTAAALPDDLGRLATALGGMAGLAAFYWLLWFVYPAGLGWGDVKLAGLLGLYLAWESVGSLVSATFLASLFSAGTGLTLMALGRATRRTSIPFGPYMIGGALAVVLLGDPLTLL